MQAAALLFRLLSLLLPIVHALGWNPAAETPQTAMEWGPLSLGAIVYQRWYWDQPWNEPDKVIHVKLDKKWLKEARKNLVNFQIESNFQNKYSDW